jgi:Spx/MgsR family transcriptional regulator
MPALYGISNCDTVRKARKFLENKDIDYTFHDYKATGINPVQLRDWVNKVGWETLLNKRSTTWRNLPKETKDNINEVLAIAVMEDQPTIIKRPVLLHNDLIIVGFSEKSYDTVL